MPVVNLALSALVIGSGLTLNGDTLSATPATASTVGYTPSVSSNWIAPQPTTVQGALDAVTAGRYLPYANDGFIVVKTTSNALTNGANLLAAYAAAAALTPNGAALSEFNRAACIVPPGVYDFGTNAGLTASAFVDLVGLATNPRNQILRSEWTIADGGTFMDFAGVNCVIANLCLQISGEGPGGNDSSDPAAYFIADGNADGIAINCVFETLVDSTNWATRISVNYNGSFYDCRGAGENGSEFGAGASAQGLFVNCVGGNNSFGGNGGTFSGTARNCTGGATSFGGGGTFSGRAFSCIAGVDSFGSVDGNFSGTAYDCSAGANSFAGGVFSGQAIGCKTTGAAFNVGGTFSATAALVACVAVNGGVAYPVNLGNSNNSPAAAGYVGEFKESIIASSSAVNLPSLTNTNITSLSLTAGDWEVWGQVGFSASGATITSLSGWTNTTSATYKEDTAFVVPSPSGNGGFRQATVRQQVLINTTTTIYLSAVTQFTGGGVSGFGVLRARRMR